MNIFGLKRTHRGAKRDHKWSHIYINSLGRDVKCIVVTNPKIGSDVFVLNEYGCTVLLDRKDIIAL